MNRVWAVIFNKHDNELFIITDKQTTNLWNINFNLYASDNYTYIWNVLKYEQLQPF